MTAVTASRHSLPQWPASIRCAVSFLVFFVAFGTTLALAAPATAAQEASATAEATPTQDELQQRRDQAIADGVDQLEVAFQEYNDSGVEGTATFYALEDQTLVAIAITGGGDEHPAYILQGTCGNTEPEPVERLTPVDETGESLSLIDRSLSDLIDGGDYAIDLRLSPDELGTLIVCANIEGTTTQATPAAGATAQPSTATAEAPGMTPTGEGGIVETPVATEAPAETPTTVATEVPAETPVAGATETPTAESQDGTGGAQAAPGAVASLPLADYSGLGVTGTVSLLAISDTTTKVTITLTGDGVTGGHIAHLHPGTCDAPQDEGTIYLATVGSDGVSETTVDISLANLLNNGWIVNVHRSEADWDTWLVCGELSDATEGMTGVTSVTPVAGGKGTSTAQTTNGTGGDGTSGVSGKGEPTSTSTLTQNVGVGSGLLWPNTPTQAIAWSLAIFALVLAAAGILLRRGERHHRQPSRWQRLGL